MNLVDSSAGSNTSPAGLTGHLRETHSKEDLVVPTLSLYEVFKRVLQQRGEGPALQAVAAMHQGNLVESTVPIALAAARLLSIRGAAFQAAAPAFLRA